MGHKVLMSTNLPPLSRHVSHRASHLRQVSNSGSDTPNNSRPGTAVSEARTIQNDLNVPKILLEKRCVLWVHDESFSKDEVVLNLTLLPEIKEGDALSIVELKLETSVRDFQDKRKSSAHESDTLSVGTQRERSNSDPRSPVSSTANDCKGGDDQGKRYLFVARDMPKELKSKNPNLEISISKHIADAFGFKHRSNCLLSAADLDTCSASHVEMTFRDEYLARSDMWRLAVGELSNKTVFRGQKVLFMGTIKVQVTAVYVGGRKVQSAFFSSDTKPIFRSESARYVLFIQMSREMWDFDSEGSGEIMFNKVVNGFLPALFKKWAALKVKHLVSIVLFSRVEYDMGIASDLVAEGYDNPYYTGIQTNGNKRPYKDFYRVVVSEMASGSWTTILYQLKREFKFFRRDISLHRMETAGEVNASSVNTKENAARGTQIEAEPSLAMHGNVLEAINLASSQFSHDYIDRDLTRTGISIVVITPCAGLFEVDYETLHLTTENLIGNGIGIDLVCLPKLPLHSVPLFRYRNPDYGVFQEELQYKTLQSEDSTPRQYPSRFATSFSSSLAESLSPTKASQTDRYARKGSVVASVPPSEWSYAIPHWVDVSFWTGASQEIASRKHLGKSAKHYLKHWSNRGTSDFAIRCKMYEMEMASVMENAMTEISITPLQHESFFPMMITGPRDGPVRQKVADKTNSVRRPRPYSALHEFVGGPSKPLVDRHSSEDFKRFLKVLESFDLSKSQYDETPKIGRNADGSKYFKPGSDEAVRRVLAEDPKLFGTSFADENGVSNEVTFMASSHSSRKRQDSQPTEAIIRPRKVSIGGMNVQPKAPSIKPGKFSRQISLGKHGFNLTAPKAAVASIQIENVSAAAPAPSKISTMEPSKTIGTNHTLGPPRPLSSRPSSSQSELLEKKEKTDINGREDFTDKIPSKPMTVKSALQSLDSTNQYKSRSVLGSFYETVERRSDLETSHTLHSVRADDTQKLYNSKLLAGAVPELPATLSPTTALSPWLTVLNPSNPAETDMKSQYRRWQHVFPKKIHVKTMKWKSLCCPASVPLTTSDFPSKYQLETEYQQKPYNISQSVEEDLSEEPKSREELLRELIALRLSHGFQIVVGPAIGEAFGQKSLKIANVFNREEIAEDGASVFMSLGNIIHQLSCVNETEVEVNTFVRKPSAIIAIPSASIGPMIYNPAIQTTLATGYDSRNISFGKPKDEYNWNYVDAYIAGFSEEMSENLRFWRARYVLIPMERPTQAYRNQGEDNEEEVRLEGIKKLTQMWQRHRVVTASERRVQTLAARKTRDPNPLDIVYKTEDPSIVVTAELETLPLLETGDPLPRRGQLIESERFRKNKYDVAALAAAIQAPVEKGGVRVQDRRWHWRMHYNCFIGLDMTTWLLENFEDIHSREEAVDFGNKLMVKEELHRIVEHERDTGRDKFKDPSLFVHVEKRHAFRDGQYFYQIAGEHAINRPGSRSGWFSQRRRDTSVPSTPLSEALTRDNQGPSRSRSSSHHDERSSSSGATTPTAGVFSSSSHHQNSGKKPRVALSKVMKYDVDPRRRSYRPERINLHYDRLHNPDNCYHIRIDWMSVTAKLIEDAIASWAATAERYGLRLVEAPIGEACSITTVHPFRSPYIIKVAVKPPDEPPRLFLDSSAFGLRDQNPIAGRHYYHKHIMKKFNFVLDIEAACNFPSDVDVTYSWGKPDFKYTQYIHRSGIVLAQITDDGDFLLLANRLYNNRTAAAREAERNLMNDPNHLESSRSNNRITSALYSANFPLSDRTTPAGSPAIRPVQTTSYSSPILKPTTFATSDVLGPSLQNSRIALSLTPEVIKKDLEKFCSDSAKLEAFYKEVYEKAAPPTAPTPPTLLRSPYGNPALAGLGSDREIPTLGLPPNILARESSASPAKFGGGMMPFLGRRSSVQIGFGGRSDLGCASGSVLGSHDGSKTVDNSPRGSVSETER